MDSDRPELSKEQQESLRETMERGFAFEEMSKSRGFELQKTYYQNLLQSFVNLVMSDGNKPLSDYEPLRQQLIGVKKLFGEMESSMQTLKNEQSKNKPS